LSSDFKAKEKIASIFEVKGKKIPVFYNKMISNLLADDQKQEADKILEHMRRNQVPITSETLEHYLGYNIRHNIVLQALQTVKEIKYSTNFFFRSLLICISDPISQLL
jgi:hypothetical protein